MSTVRRLGILPPRPTQAEREALALRADVDARLEAARMRLETAELLLASAPRDAVLLCRELLGDLAAVLSALDATGEGGLGEPLSRRRDDLARDVTLLSEGRVDGAAASRAADGLRVLLRDVVLRYRKLVRTSLSTRLDAWRTRLRVRIGIVLAGLVALAVVSLVLRPPGREAQLPAFDRDFAAGMSAIQSGDSAAAARLFRHALDTLPDAPRSADAYNNLGWSLAQLGRYDEAIAAYEAAIQRSPGSEIYQNNLALAKREREAKRK